ncbi:MAG: hypothetical protein K5Q68_14585 [Roseococcus sp.]|nr:hypothetical protein [Roseococcus sp.]
MRNSKRALGHTQLNVPEKFNHTNYAKPTIAESVAALRDMTERVRRGDPDACFVRDSPQDLEGEKSTARKTVNHLHQFYLILAFGALLFCGVQILGLLANYLS